MHCKHHQHHHCTHHYHSLQICTNCLIVFILLLLFLLGLAAVRLLLGLEIKMEWTKQERCKDSTVSRNHLSNLHESLNNTPPLCPEKWPIQRGDQNWRVNYVKKGPLTHQSCNDSERGNFLKLHQNMFLSHLQPYAYAGSICYNYKKRKKPCSIKYSFTHHKILKRMQKFKRES